MGKYPVISISLKGADAANYDEAYRLMVQIINDEAECFQFLLDSEKLTQIDKMRYETLIDMEMQPAVLAMSLKKLTTLLEKHYGQKVVVLIDEYDVPLAKAYENNFYDKMVLLLRNLFGNVLKTNSSLAFAVLTGCLRIAKESIFTGLNNFTVYSITDDEFDETFGFTSEEVQEMLSYYGLNSHFEEVKEWYDGFTFGSQRDIYNPWSITNYLKEKKLLAYWASTSSNDLINRLIQTSKPDVKEFMEELLNEREIVLNFDEQIVFDQLETKENAIWSLMVASGYLKIDKIEYRGILHVPWYHLKITNLETLGMFSEMFVGWFQNTRSNYNAFIKAMLCGNIKEMNAYMNEVALATFSSFDTGSHPSGRTQPERFYHGFVLGLLVELRDQYEVRSNRESGYGRYDVMLIPRQKNQLAFVLEFKVYDAQEELKLEDTVQSALVQIEEKDYDTELIERGISKSKIRHYGFAFEGKRVLIGE